MEPVKSQTTTTNKPHAHTYIHRDNVLYKTTYLSTYFLMKALLYISTRPLTITGMEMVQT